MDNESTNKYYTDVILYRTIAKINTIRAHKDSKLTDSLTMLRHLSDVYNDLLEFEKMYFVNKFIEYLESDYQRSFEETYLLIEEAGDIIKILEEEYGGPLYE